MLYKTVKPLALIFALALTMLLMLPGPASAATGTMHVGGQDVLDLGTSVSAYLTTDGWAWDHTTDTLMLNDDYTGGQPITINCGTNDTVKINVTDDVTITSNGPGISCTGNLNIQGTGTLTINATGFGNIGILADGSVEISGSVGDIDAGDSGIYANGSVEISGTGSVGTIDAGADGIYAAGNVTISGSVGDIDAGEDGIYARGNVTISGSVGAITSNIRSGIDAVGNVTISGSVGAIDADWDGIFSAGGSVEILASGSVGAIDANFDGINTYGSITISGSVGTIDADSDGIQAGDNITISGSVGDSNSGVGINAGDSGIYAGGNVTISGSVGDIDAGDSGIYTLNGDITISGDGSVGDITAANGHGISAGDSSDPGSGGSVKILGDGSVGAIDAYFHGIYADNSVEISGTVGDSSGVGINAGDSGIYAYSGSVNISGSVGTIDADYRGIHASGSVEISGSVGDSSTGDGIIAGGTGIYAQNGNITITGTVGAIDAGADGIFAGGSVNISGSVGDSSTGDGIIAGGTGIYAQNGNITITGTVGGITANIGSGIYANNGSVKILDDGSVGTITAAANGIYAVGSVEISGSVGAIDADLNGIYAGGGSVEILASGSVGAITAAVNGIYANGSININAYITVSGADSAFNKAPATLPTPYIATWSTNANGSNPDPSSSTYVWANTHKYVKLAPPQPQPQPTIYTVSFESNGGSAVASQNITSGSKVSEPPAPTRPGYSFDGWYTESSLSTAYNFNTAVYASFTLYAKWSATSSGGGGGGGGTSSHTVKFNTNGGGNIDNQTVKAGGTVAKPADPVKAGYSFGGWYTDSGCTKPYDFSNKVTYGFTIYAKWIEEQPQQPTYKPMAALHSPGTVVEASKTNNPLILGGQETQFPAVKIGGYNWLKLRDFAMLLANTAMKFSISYDETTGIIDINTGENYQPIGNELTDTLNEIENAVASLQRLRVNGQFIDIAAYNIGGYNYLRLRDLAIILNFAVIYDEASGGITLDLANPYNE